MRTRPRKLQESFKRKPISPSYEEINQLGHKNLIHYKEYDDFDEHMQQIELEQKESDKLQKIWVEAARKRLKDFRYGNNKLSEKEVRGIGVLYAIELILDRWRTQSRPIPEHESLKFSGAVANVQKLFNFRDQYISTIIGGMQKNDAFQAQHELVKAVVLSNPLAKPKQLRKLVAQEAKKRGMSANRIPPDSTLDKLFRVIRSEFKESKNILS